MSERSQAILDLIDELGLEVIDGKKTSDEAAAELDALLRDEEYFNCSK